MLHRSLALPAACCALLFTAACGGQEDASPISLPEDSSVVVAPAAPAPVEDGISLPTLPPVSQPPIAIGGATVIGPECAEYIAPIRELFARIDAGEALTAAEDADLETRVNGALDVCTADEYLEFQAEIFPEEAGSTE